MSAPWTAIFKCPEISSVKPHIQAALILWNLNLLITSIHNNHCQIVRAVDTKRADIDGSMLLLSPNTICYSATRKAWSWPIDKGHSLSVLMSVVYVCQQFVSKLPPLMNHRPQNRQFSSVPMGLSSDPLSLLETRGVSLMRTDTFTIGQGQEGQQGLPWKTTSITYNPESSSASCTPRGELNKSTWRPEVHRWLEVLY